MVLSGANVSFIISLLWYFFRNAKLKFKVFFTILFSWIFIFTTGLTSPSVRAGVMASSNIFAEYFSKNISTIYSLLFSLFILTIINPLSLIYSPSLHLSFLACFAVFIASKKIENFLENKIKVFKKYKFINFILSVSVSIFIFTTPYILALTSSSSIFGTLLTIFVEPLVMITTILSFLIILASFINYYLAEILGIINSLSVKIILSTAKLGAENLPIFNFYISKNFLILYYIIIFFLFLKPEINAEKSLASKVEL